MSLQSVTCGACGGAVAMEIGTDAPRCLFCGAQTLSRAALSDEIEPPGGVVPFTIDEAAADAAFRTFARSSIWYPSDIRQARLELKPLLLPAWLWSGEIETHYAGLVRAGTRSGKRPIAGQQTAQLTDILVPSSTALTRAELAAICPFDGVGEAPFDPDGLEVPYELGLLTRAAATEAAMAETASSGAEVPKPIITMPIRRVGMPRCLAVAAAPSTNLSALQTSSTRPAMIAPNAISIDRPQLMKRPSMKTPA